MTAALQVAQTETQTGRTNGKKGKKERKRGGTGERGEGEEKVLEGEIGKREQQQKESPLARDGL